MSSKETSDEPLKKGLIAWFANNHVAANILMFLFLASGLLSVFSMRTETFPPIDPRLIIVSVVYPGATPYEVADSITSRVEEALTGIDGVDRISSIASEGGGVINVELEDFVNADEVYNDVETNVNAIIDFPPEDAERPIITKVKITPRVLTLAIHGKASEESLKYWAEEIEDDLQQLPGVAITNLRGIRDYEISVEIPESSLRQYNLSLQDVTQAVQNFSADIPAGTVESNRGDVLIRVQEKRYHGDGFEKIILRTLPDGSQLTIGDIGRVVDAFQDTNLISRFNGERAAFIDVSRAETDDTLTVAQEVKDYLAQVKLPTGLKLTLQDDRTKILKERMYLMARNALLGFMLVFIILLLFLDLKLAFWTSVAIPVSFLGGMMIIHLMGYSLNMISLFALIVVLGIVVDDAIITGESIFEAQEGDAGKTDTAVLRGVKDVIAPVTVGVSTTIAAFAPLIFSTGTLGQIIMVIPIVVIAILVVSLIEAYFILPSHLSNPKRWSVGIMRDIRNTFKYGLEQFIENIFLPVSRFLMTWRYATVAAFIGFAIITFNMVSSGTIRFIFFPQIESDEVTINVTMPQGTPFSLTEETMIAIEKAAENVRQQISTPTQDVYESVSVSIGQIGNDSGGPGESANSTNANNLGQIKLRLVSSDLRDKSASQIEGMIREKIKDLPNIEELEFQSSLVGEEADIELELSHPQEESLNAAAEELKTLITKINGTKEVSDSFEPGKAEYIFKINKQGYAVGLTPALLGQQLRAAFFGFEAQRIQRGNSEVIVYVRYPKQERESLAALQNMRIRLGDGREVPLSSVANIETQLGYSQINSVNGRRVVSVSADADYAVTTPNQIMNQLDTEILPQLMAKYQGLSYSYEGESREQSEDLASLLRNMLISLMVIYVLLGGLLRSYIEPLIIMSAIPFGVVGATWGHYLLGHDLTFISLFGVVALTGVVVNDSVVLMDYLNKQKRAGHSSFDAAIAAIRRRFRPILLTTMTTSLGLLPILLEKSLQAQFLIPMVISLATGIIFASVIIMILVPNLVVISEDVKRLAHRLKEKIFKAA